MSSTTLDKAISRAANTTSEAADYISVFAWIGVVLSVLLVPFTMGASLLILLATPVEFGFSRIVKEQARQTQLMKVMIRVQAGVLVDEPEEVTKELTDDEVEAQRRRIMGLDRE